MSWLRLSFAALLGLVIAPAAGLVVLPVLVLLDPVTRDTSFALAELFFLRLGEADSDMLAAEEAEAFLAFLYTAVIAVGFVPVALVALIGGLARQRSWMFYAAATGIVSAAMPWILRAGYRLDKASSASPQELRFALVLFLAGVVTGSVYWFVTTALGNGREKPLPSPRGRA